MLERLAALDVELFKAIHQALWGTPWLHVLRVVQLAGEGAGMPVLLGVAFLLSPAGRRIELVLRLIAPVAIGGGCSELLKHLLKVERPRILVPDCVLNPDPDLPKHFSWPSGHTTAVFAFATAVLLLRIFEELPRRRWTAASVLAFGIAALTGLARVAVGAHFPGDVIGGAVLGVSTANLVARVVGAIQRRRHPPTPVAKTPPRAV